MSVVAIGLVPCIPLDTAVPFSNVVCRLMSTPPTRASTVSDSAVWSGRYLSSARRVMTSIGSAIWPWPLMTRPCASERTVTSW